MFGIPGQRTVADVDAELACHAWVEAQAIDALNATDAAYAHRRIDELLEERFALRAPR